MSRVITFSTKFPAKHPKAGQPTFFVERVLRSLSVPHYWDWYHQANKHLDRDILWHFMCAFRYADNGLKNHTIRVGKRWKEGDWFSPRVWSGRPYVSKQIAIAPDMQIAKVWNVEIKPRPDRLPGIWINGSAAGPFAEGGDVLGKLAANDGLSQKDFLDWFAPAIEKGGFDGQILCWNPEIKY